jgi:hypothetical protein
LFLDVQKPSYNGGGYGKGYGYSGDYLGGYGGDKYGDKPYGGKVR